MSNAALFEKTKRGGNTEDPSIVEWTKFSINI